LFEPVRWVTTAGAPGGDDRVAAPTGRDPITIRALLAPNAPTSRRRSTGTALLAIVATAVLALLLRLVYGPGNLGFDGAFSLVWGDELRRLEAPDYGAAVTPTPHPLANAVAVLASLAGDRGPGVLIALSFASYAALALVAYTVGRRGFGAAAGVAFAAIVLTRPLLVGETLQASTDIPFLALVLGGLALEQGRERRGASVLVMLALAGLLRPDAWPIAAAYAVYVLADPERRADRASALRVVALALSGPVLWLLSDLVTTGDALHSLTRTQDLAAHLERERGIAAAFRDLPTLLKTVLGAEVTWLGIATGALAVLVAQRRARLPLALLVFGLANFLALGAAQLPLLNRYLLVPSIAVALFCAAGLGAFQWLRAPGPWRFAGIALSVVVAAVLAAGVPDARTNLRGATDHAHERRLLYADLLELADTARRRGLTRTCSPLQAAVYRPVPVLAYRLGVEPSKIEVVRPFRARRGLVFAAHVETLVGDVGLYPGVVIPMEHLELPKGFASVQTNGWGTLAKRGC
jgi:hypothetical protein